MKVGDWAWHGISQCIICEIESKMDYMVGHVRDLASIRYIGGSRMNHGVPLAHLVPVRDTAPSVRVTVPHGMDDAIYSPSEISF